MMNSKRIGGKQGFDRIAINGHCLDEVQTRLDSEGSQRWLSYVSAPVERHRVNEDTDGITITLPALTALQLFHDGVLSTDPQKSADLSISARPRGA